MWICNIRWIHKFKTIVLFHNDPFQSFKDPPLTLLVVGIVRERILSRLVIPSGNSHTSMIILLSQLH